MTDLSQTALTDYGPAETGINESDDRHRRLLRAGRERPRRRGAECGQ
jgi:hypothetical protein